MQPLAILISGNGSNLQAIIDTIGADRISVVISNNPDAYGLIRANNHGIRTCIIDHRLYVRDAFDQALYECIQEFNPTLIILAGFMRILGASFVQKYENRILNIHPSLLPKYKGLNTYQRAIDDDEYEHGVSIHVVIPELDGGLVLMQGRYYLEDGDSIETLQARGLELEHQMYPKLIQMLIDGEIQIDKMCKPIEFTL